jgi:N-acetylneuraminic acid mutarotase
MKRHHLQNDRLTTSLLRFPALTLVLTLVLCSVLPWSSAASSQSETIAQTSTTPSFLSFSAIANMTKARSSHTATLLPSGKVLFVAGNEDVPVYDENATPVIPPDAEVYDPATNTWTMTGSLKPIYLNHTATLLGTGKVLAVGGTSDPQLYDPATNSWSDAGAMLINSYSYHTATLLPDGKVLVAGGRRTSHINSPVLARAEIYDPATDSWSATGSMSTARYGHQAALLPNGKVLVVGGRDSTGTVQASAELYDPTTGTWSATGNMSIARANQSLTLLDTGKVLAVGGSGTSGRLTSAELYDPATGTWSSTGSMLVPRAVHTATLLTNGTVVVVGGVDKFTYENRTLVETYDPSTGQWHVSGLTQNIYYANTATLLTDGKLLVAGSFPDIKYASKYAEVGTLTEDDDLPTGVLWMNGGALASTSRDVTVTIGLNDATSKIGQISFSHDGVTWEPWQIYGKSILPWKLADGDGTKTIHVRFKDYAGNEGTASRTVTLNTAVGTEYGLSINGGALFTNQITVALQIAAPAYTQQMMISNDGGFAGATWEPFNTNKTWQISQHGVATVPRTVYIRFKDANGNISSTFQDDILLDVTAPTGSVTILSNSSQQLQASAVQAAETSANTTVDYTVLLPFVVNRSECPALGTESVTLGLTAEDDASGVGAMMISNSASFACAQWEPFSKTKAWKAPAGEKQTVYVRFRDNAGNISQVYSTIAKP